MYLWGGMYDTELRRLKNRMLNTLLPLFLTGIYPFVYTMVALLFGVLTIVTVISGEYILAGIFWIFNRFFDILDGYTAVKSEKSSGRGALLDLFFDFVSYLGIMVAIIFINMDDLGIILVGSLLLASYCMNLLLWQYPLVLNPELEMPRGIVEGFETAIFYSIFLFFPCVLFYSLSLFLILMIVTVLHRLFFGIRITSWTNRT